MQGLGWFAMPQVGIYSDPYEMALPLAVIKLPADFRNVGSSTCPACFLPLIKAPA